MRTALGRCVVFTVVPLVASLAFALTCGIALGFAGRSYQVMLHLGFAFSLITVAWWCKGMFALSNQLLSKQRMLAGLVAFLLPIPVAWELVTNWSVDFVQSVDSEVRQSFRSAPTNVPWAKHAIQIIVFPESKRFFVEGKVGDGSAKALANAIARHPDIKLIELESPGGFVDEASQMAMLIEKNGLDTLARGRCASACTEIFLAGMRRYVGPDARFGFHQSGNEPRARNTEWGIPEYISSINYRQKGVAPGFTDKALNTSYFSMWRPDVLDVKRSGFATAWWSDRPSKYQ